jgi:hypothetical protein|tara:strand:- start:7 stop:522 length:516 start_codon:yes stop_codon:yes gene_type:complete
MGTNFLRNRKGQISIEFILIMLIALIYIYSVIQPTLQISAQSTEDVAMVSNVKLSAQKLAGAINQLEANASDGQRTIGLFIPDGTYIECTDDPVTTDPAIEFSATLSDNLGTPSGCSGANPAICTESISLLIDPTCDFGGGSEKLEAVGGNIFEKFVVKKEAGGISVGYAT